MSSLPATGAEPAPQPLRQDSQVSTGPPGSLHQPLHQCSGAAVPVRKDASRRYTELAPADDLFCRLLCVRLCPASGRQGRAAAIRLPACLLGVAALFFAASTVGHAPVFVIAGRPRFFHRSTNAVNRRIAKPRLGHASRVPTGSWSGRCRRRCFADHACTSWRVPCGRGGSGFRRDPGVVVRASPADTALPMAANNAGACRNTRWPF